MGREIRKVPASWEHPRDKNGDYIPLLYKWDPEDENPIEVYMPQWKEKERTHYMMYEDTSEGTPISPAFVTVEEVAHYLTDNNESVFADIPGTYEQWLAIANGHRSLSLPLFALKKDIISPRPKSKKNTKRLKVAKKTTKKPKATTTQTAECSII